MSGRLYKTIWMPESNMSCRPLAGQSKFVDRSSQLPSKKVQSVPDQTLMALSENPPAPFAVIMASQSSLGVYWYQTQLPGPDALQLLESHEASTFASSVAPVISTPKSANGIDAITYSVWSGPARICRCAFRQLRPRMTPWMTPSQSNGRPT